MNMPPPPPPQNNNPFNNGGYQQQMSHGPVNNYMAFAILTTLFCCLPFGIVSIVQASQVNKRLAMGDYTGAVQASKQAKTWAVVSTCVGVAVIAIYMLAIAGAASSNGVGL